MLAGTLSLCPWSFKTARAEPTAAELTTARELFEAGLALEDQGKWDDALENFKKVAAVKASPQVRFHMGLCLKNTGKLTDALNEFMRSQADTKNDSNVEAQKVFANSAKHIADLKERIPRVIIKVPSDVTGMTVTVDDSAITATLLGSPLPVDPGSHKVAAKAPGKIPFEQTIQLEEKGKTVTVEVELPVDPNAPADAPPTGDTGAPTAGPKDQESTAGAHGGRGPLPWVIGGVGVASLIGGGVFFLLRQGTISDIENGTNGAPGCPSHANCSPALKDSQSAGQTYTTVGNVLLGVGAAAVATSVILFIVMPSGSKPDAPKTEQGKRPYVTVGSGPTPLGIGPPGCVLGPRGTVVWLVGLPRSRHVVTCAGVAQR